MGDEHSPDQKANLWPFADIWLWPKLGFDQFPYCHHSPEKMRITITYKHSPKQKAIPYQI